MQAKIPILLFLGYRSYRATTKGSWFIRTLVDVVKQSLSDGVYATHLLDILTEVSKRVAAKDGTTKPSNSDLVSVLSWFQYCISSDVP